MGKKIVFLVLLIICLPVFVCSQEAYRDIYGVGVPLDSLSNLRVGPSAAAGREVDFRFRAAYSKSLTSFKVWYKSGSGYSMGATTDLRASLYADDGTGNHRPNKTSELAYKEWTHTNSAAYYFELVTFETPYTVTEGNLYHIYIKNVSANKDTNYVSVNYLQRRPPGYNPRNAYIADLNLEVMGWTSVWTHYTVEDNGNCLTPMYTIYYSDATYQGLVYADSQSGAPSSVYSTTRKIRERFTVTGGNKIITSAYVYVQKLGSPPNDLQIRLEDSSNDEIETITVPAANIATDSNWEGGNFVSSHTLLDGNTYYLVLQMTAGNSSNCYRAYEINQRTSDFSGWYFSDGYWQKTINGSDWTSQTTRDLMFYFDAAPGISAAVTGTLADGATEAQIVAGGETLIVTLANDTWVAAGGVFDAIRQDIIDGLDSGGVEAHGWDVEVKGNMAVGEVVRTNATVVTITLAAQASYSITQNETITATIPATALVESSSPVIATPTFEITAASDPVAVLTGTLADNATEGEVVAGGETCIITLTNDTWVAAGGVFDAVRQDIIDGMDSAQSEGTGWNAEVRDKEVVGAVVRDTATQVTITLTAAAAYDISANETITVTVPASALVTSGSPVVATPTYSIIFFDTSTEEIVGITLQ